MCLISLIFQKRKKIKQVKPDIFNLHNPTQMTSHQLKQDLTKVV